MPDEHADHTYAVVTSDDLDHFCGVVGEMLRKGWKCQGGIFVLRAEWENARDGSTDWSTTYHQALTKEQAR